MIGDPRLTSPNRPRLLTRKQAAERVGKSEGTIRYWIKEGLRERLGGRILESELLDMDRRMRERRGRPRIVDPRDALLAEVVAEWDRLNTPDRVPPTLGNPAHERAFLVREAASALAALAAHDDREAER